ncbi:MAG: alanine--tRNA ligase [Candidatus Micrarchaeota archaeon]|nr:alanine--tRNA ligase [Candidatus Micrarchaeota archaeon]
MVDMIDIDTSKISKESLKKEFAKKPEEYYNVALFDEQGFERRTCRHCGKKFWSITDTDSCGDSSHTEYTFFKEKPVPTSYTDFWKDFASFFKKNGHAEVKRYPVVSRWRQDLYFTIASIQDFQRIESGAMSFEYGSNPLVVPQICLRFSDIENVGVTGRHLTSFTMAGQHAFDYPKSGYWRDRCIELNFNYLTKVLGVNKKDLVYAEDVWAMGDFSEFGPSLESFAKGAELVNSVFTQFELANGRIRELPGKVVDVGWGFERLMWFHSGFDTAYEAVFHGTITKLKPKIGFEIDNRLFKRFSAFSSELDITESGGKSKEMAMLRKAGISEHDYETKIKPMQALYAVLDHTRTLLFAISDGALPSNVGGGYNLRVILRRAISFMETYDLSFDLNELAAMEAAELKPLFPELSESLVLYSKVLDIEKARFSRTRENAGKIIDRIISKGSGISAQELRTLYESNGITPELIEATAAKKGAKMRMPESSYEDIVKGDFAVKEKGKKFDIDVKGIPKTEQLYYKLDEQSNSRILKVHHNLVVLDETPFYPEGGGQEADHGTINGFKVSDVQKVGDVIVHLMGESVEGKRGMSEGSAAKCLVDRERRRRLMVHHTATHLMSAAARAILGKHAWQEGTRKEFEKAHIDISHYDKLSDAELMELENFVNSRILNGIKVTVSYMDRKDAEGRYGFAIYQGHGVPAKRIRIVLIEDTRGNFIDAEACGGLHVTGMEQAIGAIKIIDSERIHDGINRIEFVAGSAALDYFRKEHNELLNVSTMLHTDRFGVGEKAAAIRDETKELSKMLEQYKEIAANEIARTAPAGKVIELELDVQKDVMRKVANILAAKNKSSVIFLKNRSNELICIAGENSKTSAIDFAREKTKGMQFLGGGSQTYAEGRISKV